MGLFEVRDSIYGCGEKLREVLLHRTIDFGRSPRYLVDWVEFLSQAALSGDTFELRIIGKVVPEDFEEWSNYYGE